jgi:hypothetical protein
VRNDACCQAESITIGADEPSGSRSVTLSYLPGSVVPVCPVPGVQVTVDGRPAKMGRANTILLSDSLRGVRKIRVEFVKPGATGSGSYDSQTVVVRYREKKTVKCGF